MEQLHPVQQIIDRAGAPRIAEVLGLPPVNVRMWRQRKSIPPEHWRGLADHKLATLDELADAAHGAAA